MCVCVRACVMTRCPASRCPAAASSRAATLWPPSSSAESVIVCVVRGWPYVANTNAAGVRRAGRCARTGLAGSPCVSSPPAVRNPMLVPPASNSPPFRREAGRVFSHACERRRLRARHHRQLAALPCGLSDLVVDRPDTAGVTLLTNSPRHGACVPLRAKGDACRARSVPPSANCLWTICPLRT